MKSQSSFLFLVVLLGLLLSACTTTDTTPPPSSSSSPTASPIASITEPSTPEAPTTAPSATTSIPTPTTAATPAPTPAPVVTELPPASITGSEESSTMLDNFTVFVSAVDGVPVPAGRDGWNAALPLKAGVRRLTLTFNRGVFSAKTEIALNAMSGTAYQVKFATDAQLFGRNSYCEFWIVNATTGEPVVARVRTTLTRTEVK